MSPCTRRRTLLGAVGLLAGFAGCSESDRERDRPTPTRTFENVERAPDTFSLRNPDGEYVIRIDREQDGESSEDESPSTRFERTLISDTETATKLEFASDVPNAAGAREFITETNFDEETLYVNQQRVGECYTLELDYVTWTATEVRTSFRECVRSPDIECSADGHDPYVMFIRIPDTLDESNITGIGSTVSGRCAPQPEHPDEEEST